ncbi:MAG TPA: hypothetical protein VFU22_24560 [Roseiflexaceae bacterium]|nr:hypothetical protein [Roseiflexaceae bacterium]
MADKPGAMAMADQSGAMADNAAPTAAASAAPLALASGMFTAGSTPGDTAAGKATIYQLGDGMPLLRLEDFSITEV